MQILLLAQDTQVDTLIDTFFRIQSFQRKYDILAVLIIFDSRETENSGPGYRHPGRGTNSSESFPVVVCCPGVSINLLLFFFKRIYF